MTLVDRTYSTFTTRELERLMVYRAAVAAGFYTDWDGSAETADTEAEPPAEAGTTAEQPAR
jgi:hypothetical protein